MGVIFFTGIFHQDDPKKAPAYKLAVQNYRKSSQNNFSFKSEIVKQVFKKLNGFTSGSVFIINQTRCLANEHATEKQKCAICALAIVIFLRDEISYSGNTNSVNIRTQPLTQPQVLTFC